MARVIAPISQVRAVVAPGRQAGLCSANRSWSSPAVLTCLKSLPSGAAARSGGRMADLQGIDLWRVENQAGGSVAKAVNYLTPFIRQPELWKKQQIRPFDRNRTYFPALAGLASNQVESLRLFHEITAGENEPELLLLRLLILAPRSVGD